MTTDPADLIGGAEREVATRIHDGREARAVIATRTYPTDPADLWDALTNAERLPRWFLPISGDLRLGGRYQFQGNAGGTITACEPPRRLAVTWEFGGGVTWLEVTLTALGSDTRLRLEHLAHVDPRWGQFGPGAVGIGWDLGLMGLTRHLASGGAAVDPAAVMAWTVSVEGKAFIRTSSDGWSQAAIAAGDDPREAHAAAARTTAFYLGEPDPTAG